MGSGPEGICRCLQWFKFLNQPFAWMEKKEEKKTPDDINLNNAVPEEKNNNNRRKTEVQWWLLHLLFYLLKLKLIIQVKEIYKQAFVFSSWVCNEIFNWTKEMKQSFFFQDQPGPSFRSTTKSRSFGQQY